LKLALDTSQSSGSIALWDSGRIVYSAYFNIAITHSETLMPQLDAGLRLCGYAVSDIKAVLLTLGPGSFTGLRIGLASAKGIAYGLRIPLLSFDTLRLCALQRHKCGCRILSVLDAKMHQVYAALYDEDLIELQSPRVCAAEELVDWDARGCYLLGSGSDLVQPVLESAGFNAVRVYEQPLNAAGLFQLAELFPQEEIYDFDRLAELEPLYLRESTAQVRLSQG